ncbi:MAG: class I adenylate-forming enzyme family protein [Armatimonadota bacterium]|nr:class I adenylate-forming enzyme family protein [Armatimonadota bacterium]
MSPDPIVDAIAQCAARAPWRPAVTDGTVTLTYGELWAESDVCAEVLARGGVRAGEAVGILLPNCARFVTALLAIARLRAVALLLPTTLTPAELHRYAVLAGAHVVLTGPSHRAVVLEAGGQPVAAAADLLLYTYTVDAPAARGVGPDDFIVQLTSGADRPSKLAVRTRAAVWDEIDAFADAIGLTARETTLVLPSIFHSYGLIGGTLAPLCRGGRVVLHDNFDPQVVLQAIRRERPTIVFAVPVMYRHLVRAPQAQGADLSSVRLCFSAGAPLPGDVDAAFARRFGCRISQNYGSTEAGVIALRQTWAPHLQHSVGRPVRGRTVTVVDDRGRALPPGQRGEVVVCSAAVARGYLGDAPGAPVLLPGRFHTGDLGWVDDDGYLFLAGRKSSLIHLTEGTVDPAAIEAVIASLPAVRDVAVVGVPGPGGSEQIKAVVVADDVGPEQILRYCRHRLPTTQLPAIVELRDAIPRTPAGKVVRRLLR